MPTEHGSPIYRGNRPFADAACVALICAWPAARSSARRSPPNSPTAIPGETVNPHNPAHTPGGSSSGSAAAVADFQVPAGARHADRRLGDPAGGVLRRHRLQAELWRVQPQSASRCSATISTRSASSAAASRICRRCARRSCRRRPRTIDRASAAPRIGFCRTPAWDRADAGDPGADRAHRRAACGGRRRGHEMISRRNSPNILDHHRRIFEFRGGAQLRL